MTEHMIHLDDLLGLAEIAINWNVPYSTALSWSRQRTFPAPVKQFKMGPAWDRHDVANWRQERNTAKEA